MKTNKEIDTLRRIEKVINWYPPLDALQRINYILRKYVRETGECLEFILDPTPGTDEEAEKWNEKQWK